MILSSVLLSYLLKELKYIDISAFSFFVIPISITVILFFVMVSGIYSNDIYSISVPALRSTLKLRDNKYLVKDHARSTVVCYSTHCTRFVFHLFKNLTVRTTCYYDYDDLREREKEFRAG